MSQQTIDILHNLNNCQNPINFHNILITCTTLPFDKLPIELHTTILSKLISFPSSDIDIILDDEPNIEQLFTNIISHPNTIIPPALIPILSSYNIEFCIPILTMYLSNKQFNPQHITALFTTLQNVSYYIRRNLIEFIENNASSMDSTSQILEIAATFFCEKFILTQINKRVLPTQQCLYEIIKHNDLSLSKTLILSGCILDTTCLVLACKQKNLSIIRFILDNNIKPTTECFSATLEPLPRRSVHSYSSKILSRKSKTSSTASIASTIPATPTEIIDLLITHGLTLTLNDIMQATKRKILINNFSSLSIILPDNFIDVCKVADFYPLDAYNIKPTIDCLEHICSKPHSLKNIKYFISLGIQPTTKCLQLACTVKNNAPTIKFLIESHHLVPDITAISSLLKTFNNPSLNIAFPNFCANHEITTKSQPVQFIPDTVPPKKVMHRKKQRIIRVPKINP